MYEQNNESPWRRIAAISLAFLAVVALLWVLTWLIFFRHHDSKKVAVPRHTTTQQQSAPSAKSSDNSATNTSPNATAPSTTPGASTPATPPQNTSTQPSQLANTGAGNIVVPFVSAVVVGAVLYEVRLRKAVG